MKYLVILGLCYLCICYADDTIYQYTDKNGNLVISNKPQNLQGNKRRQILNEELAKEQIALKEAKDLLAQNTNISDSQKRRAILEDAITEHQKNIDILNKQLGREPQ